MKIYDTHSDILFNLYQRHMDGEQKIFERYHLNNLKKGGVVGGIWVVYSETDFDVFNAYKIALEEFAPYKNKFDVVYGLEGLRNVATIEDFDKLYNLGVRHASLTWNEENHFATGVAGDKDRGLQPLGKELLKYMNEKNMIIDVSHLNVKSFYDVLEENPKILIASHSDAYSLSNHRRNLNDDQLKKLKEQNGFVGVNSARNFVSHEKEKQNIDGLIDHIIYIGEHIGIDHVMFGLDMMDFLSDYDNANLNDLRSHADACNIESHLIKRGFTKEEIEMIGSKNFLRAITNVKE